MWSARVGGRPIRLRRRRSRCRALAARKRAARRGRANRRCRTRLHPADRCLDRQGPRAHRSPGARPARVAHRRRAALIPRDFRVDPQPGSFRVTSDPGPFVAALWLAPPPDPSSPQVSADRRVEGLQALVDRFKNEGGGRTVVGGASSERRIPAVGPSVFLAAELTAEARAPSVDLISQASPRSLKLRRTS